jgi:hypothetical protein
MAESDHFNCELRLSNCLGMCSRLKKYLLLVEILMKLSIILVHLKPQMSYRGRCPNPSGGVRKREGIGAKTKDAMLASSSGNRVKTRTAVNTWTYYKADVFIYSARYLPIGLASTRFSLAEFTLHINSNMDQNSSGAGQLAAKSSGFS